MTKKIYELTGGVPQAVNELCYEIAIAHYDKNKDIIDSRNPEVYTAQTKWINGNMKVVSSVIHRVFIENIKNEPNLNFVLYSLTEVKPGEEFTVQQIEAKVDELMGNPNRTVTKKSIKRFLDKLSDEVDNNNLLINTNINSYKIQSFKTSACLKIVLYIDSIDKNDQVKWVDDIEWIM